MRSDESAHRNFIVHPSSFIVRIVSNVFEESRRPAGSRGARLWQTRRSVSAGACDSESDYRSSCSTAWSQSSSLLELPFADDGRKKYDRHQADHDLAIRRRTSG